VNTSRASQEGTHSPSSPNGLIIIIISNAHSPSWPNGLIIIIIIIIMLFDIADDVNTSRAPEEGAHSPTWPKELIIIIIIIILSIPIPVHTL
jgi:hypothetical protein